LYVFSSPIFASAYANAALIFSAVRPQLHSARLLYVFDFFWSDYL
jgi:hypothetical protein